VIVGYARTSTLEQVAGFEAQKRDLEAAGCQECYEEQVSSVAERTELGAALKYVRKGDTFVVTKLDRLARSVRDLCRIVDMLDKKGVALRILNLGIDTGTATGKLVVQILGAIAEFERAMMLERQREGIAKAHAEGKYQGRVPTAERQAEAILTMFVSGHRTDAIAERLQISQRSVQRIIKKARRRSPEAA
jgi:DNA invertase Pin-like site-specific DNA recombinase